MQNQINDQNLINEDNNLIIEDHSLITNKELRNKLTQKICEKINEKMKDVEGFKPYTQEMIDAFKNNDVPINRYLETIKIKEKRKNAKDLVGKLQNVPSRWIHTICDGNDENSLKLDVYENLNALTNPKTDESIALQTLLHIVNSKLGMHTDTNYESILKNINEDYKVNSSPFNFHFITITHIKNNPKLSKLLINSKVFYENNPMENFLTFNANPISLLLPVNPSFNLLDNTALMLDIQNVINNVDPNIKEYEGLNFIEEFVEYAKITQADHAKLNKYFMEKFKLEDGWPLKKAFYRGNEEVSYGTIFNDLYTDGKYPDDIVVKDIDENIIKEINEANDVILFEGKMIDLDNQLNLLIDNKILIDLNLIQSMKDFINDYKVLDYELDLENFDDPEQKRLYRIEKLLEFKNNPDNIQKLRDLEFNLNHLNTINASKIKEIKINEINSKIEEYEKNKNLEANKTIERDAQKNVLREPSISFFNQFYQQNKNISFNDLANLSRDNYTNLNISKVGDLEFDEANELLNSPIKKLPAFKTILKNPITINLDDIKKSISILSIIKEKQEKYENYGTLRQFWYRKSYNRMNTNKDLIIQRLKSFGCKESFLNNISNNAEDCYKGVKDVFTKINENKDNYDKEIKNIRSLHENYKYGQYQINNQIEFLNEYRYGNNQVISNILPIYAKEKGLKNVNEEFIKNYQYTGKSDFDKDLKEWVSQLDTSFIDDEEIKTNFESVAPKLEQIAEEFTYLKRLNNSLNETIASGKPFDFDYEKKKLKVIIEKEKNDPNAKLSIQDKLSKTFNKKEETLSTKKDATNKVVITEANKGK